MADESESGPVEGIEGVKAEADEARQRAEQGD